MTEREGEMGEGRREIGGERDREIEQQGTVGTEAAANNGHW
jgi:hypothetical protein